MAKAKGNDSVVRRSNLSKNRVYCRFVLMNLIYKVIKCKFQTRFSYLKKTAETETDENEIENEPGERGDEDGG